MADTDTTTFRGAPFVPLLAVILILAFSNGMANLVVPDWAYVPWNLAIAAAVVTVAVRFDDQRTDTMGLSRARLGAGLKLGFAISSVLAALMVAGLLIPATREIFMDARSNVPFWEMAYKVFIQVPIGTVLLEEVSFRGVIPAMVQKRLRPGKRRRLAADGVAAILFGFWHILPSFSLDESNQEVAKQVNNPLVLQLAGTIGSVLVTATIAMAFSWMRNRSDSVAAPAVFHTTSNSLGTLLAWIAQRVL